MLTISISEALQGPAALSAWGYPDVDTAAAAEAWQSQLSATQWGLDGQSAEDALTGNALELADPSLWSPWPADAGLQAEASLSLAAAMASCSAGTAPAVEEGLAKATSTNEAAFASPLRVPLPEPLAVEPLSQNLELGLELELIELPETAAEPQKISAAPGLGSGTHKNPKPTMAGAQPPARAVATTAMPQKQAPLALAAVTEPAPPGIMIRPGEVGGLSCTHVDWKIDDFSGKLQASMGRPVVSPAFSASGLSNLRLMVFPDARDAVKSARSHERKGLYTTMVKKGPLYGSLKLKADGLERATVMTFSLLVGNVRSGPSTYDFSEQAVLGLDDFGVDWLQQVDKNSGALHVGIEIIEVRQK